MSAELGTDVFKAKRFLEEGQVVGVPTETVYGLAGNAYDPQAVIRIFNVKQRPAFDPLIVHTDSIARVKEFVEDIPEKAFLLMQKYWPGPLTILLKKKQRIPDLVTSGSALVAVRIPAHPLTLRLLASLDFPLAAPSANPFGYISPTTAVHVNDQLGNDIPYILDGGPSKVGIESTIIGFEKEESIIYRLGGISIEHLENELGKVKMHLISNSKPSSPGMLTSHYAPRKYVIQNNLEKALSLYKVNEISYLAFKEFNSLIPKKNQVVLSDTGNLEEAAMNLFDGLRKLDVHPTKVIVTELVPDQGLGRAINDRLLRASAK